MTLGDALEAHEFALSKGGRPGMLSLDVLESALARPYHGYHRQIWSKAAALLHGVVSSHGFVDGNKRTALILLGLLVERSGYRLDIELDFPIDDIVVDVASGAMSQSDLEEWLRATLSKS